MGSSLASRKRVWTGSEAGLKESGAPAWVREPREARSVSGVVFTPEHGVIHPSFPLRGRWERPIQSGAQAPSPSLAALLRSSIGTRPRLCILQKLGQSLSLHPYSNFPHFCNLRELLSAWPLLPAWTMIQFGIDPRKCPYSAQSQNFAFPSLPSSRTRVTGFQHSGSIAPRLGQFDYALHGRVLIPGTTSHEKDFVCLRAMLCPGGNFAFLHQLARGRPANCSARDSAQLFLPVFRRADTHRLRQDVRLPPASGTQMDGELPAEAPHRARTGPRFQAFSSPLPPP